MADEAWASNTPAVRLMLELGFAPALGHRGGTALHNAAWQGSAETVAALLASPAAHALINSRDGLYDGLPLGWCCHGSVNSRNPAARHAEVARMLIEAGAEVPADMQGSNSVNVVLAQASGMRR
jgi:ankyrin repeat protein